MTQINRSSLELISFYTCTKDEKFPGPKLFFLRISPIGNFDIIVFSRTRSPAAWNELEPTVYILYILYSLDIMLWTSHMIIGLTIKTFVLVNRRYTRGQNYMHGQMQSIASRIHATAATAGHIAQLILDLFYDIIMSNLFTSRNLKTWTWLPHI